MRLSLLPKHDLDTLLPGQNAHIDSMTTTTTTTGWVECRGVFSLYSDDIMPLCPSMAGSGWEVDTQCFGSKKGTGYHSVLIVLLI